MAHLAFLDEYMEKFSILHYTIIKDEEIIMALNILIIGYGYVGQQLGKLLTTNTNYSVYATKRTYINQAHGAQMIFKPTIELTEDDFPDVDYVFYCASADTREVESYQDTYVDELQHVLTLLTKKNHPP